jgi:hypothetical protein
LLTLSEPDNAFGRVVRLQTPFMSQSALPRLTRAQKSPC